MKKLLFPILVVLMVAGCSPKKQKVGTQEKSVRIVNVPIFNGDSSYAFVKKQVDYGPRIPNSTAHVKTGDFFVNKLRSYGAKVIEQSFDSQTFDGQRVKLRNIIASFYTEKSKRILLATHWDTRPFADKDAEKPNALFDGANDGASGVGVLLEVARLLQTTAPEVGIDIILFDGEDWGEPDARDSNTPLPQGLDSWWCLGSQYWAKHKHQPNYSAYYGILLDMVGGKNARFFREKYSMDYAPSIVEKVWNTASTLGYSHVFINSDQGTVTDDHVYVNTIAKIPMIDIISFDPTTGSFGNFHHTRQDNMSLISKETLQIVGTTLTSVIYYEE